MTGILCALAGRGGGSRHTVVSGSYNSGGKVSPTLSGYSGNAAITGATFGSISPTTSNGLTIIALYHSTYGTIQLYVSGNCVGAYSQVSIAGTAYSFGSSSYDGANNRTNFLVGSTSTTTPFSGTVTVVLS